jgi:glycosyltransferase involved in cell wall biosynthesis
MAAGKSIIGAVSGSCANFIEDNVLGYACPSRDSNSLAELIRCLEAKELPRIGIKSKEVYFSNILKVNLSIIL